jgi:hypothetical protein
MAVWYQCVNCETNYQLTADWKNTRTCDAMCFTEEAEEYARGY